jgi:hypothetical protein
MASSSTMAFATTAAGQVVAACDLPSVGPAVFRCAGCGGEVMLCRPAGSRACFRHPRPAHCDLGALRALHAAALQLLVESRFVEAPPLTQNGKGQGKHRLIEQWGEMSVRTRIEGVPVDLYAETLAGPLIIQVAVRSLYDPITRLGVKALGYAALEISISRPDAITSIGELREVVLRRLTNKIWLAHPAIGNRAPRAQREPHPVEMALFGEVEKPAAKLSMPVAAAPWVRAGELVAEASYRQMSPADRIRTIELQLGSPCDRWPDAVNIDVAGKESFGCDARIWQADVFGKFVRPATQQGAGSRDFSMLTVFGWLNMRYRLEPTFKDSEKVACYQYLRELSVQGYLMELPERHFRVLPEPHPEGLSTLQWNPEARLSVSGLRVCSERVRLEIPANQVQRLLEYFEDGHPAMPVVAFVQDLMVRLRSPARTIVALLREAHLILG